MFPKLIRKTPGSSSPQSGPNDLPIPASGNSRSDASASHVAPSGTADGKRRPSVVDFMTKSGQLFTTIQGTLDKQLGHFAEAVHLTSNENTEFFSNLPLVSSKDFDPYLTSVREHWNEYKEIRSSLLRTKDSQISTAAQIDDSTNAFREIPQVFFNTDYKQSGFEQHQIFTQPLRISVQSQGKLSGVLSGYQKKIEQHLVKHLSNVDGLLRSLMSVAIIQSDIGVAQDRARNAHDKLAAIKAAEVTKGFRMLLLARRRERIREVLKVLDLCEQVAQAKPSVDSLVRTGDFSAATDLVQATRAILGSELAGVLLLDNIRSFIDEHGRNIDSVIESEFSDLVAGYLFEQLHDDSQSVTRMMSMLTSMSVRDLLVPCLQIKLKEVLPKRLKKEMKGIGASAAYLSGSEKMFDYLFQKLTRLAELLALVDETVGIGLDAPKRQIQRLSSLRLFETITAAGLAKCSQSVSAKLNDVPSETASVVSSQVGGGESIDPFTVLRIAELRSVRFFVTDWLRKIEDLYNQTFSKNLEEHISFTSSILKSASQNGFSPDVEATISNVALQRLLQFQPAALAHIDSLLSEEKWDKSTAIPPEIVKTIATLDPTPSVLLSAGLTMDGSDSSPSSSLLPTKQLRINKQAFLIVPAGLPIVQLVNECLSLGLTVPGVAVECLSRISSIVRTINGTCRELVLEGQMTVKQKKVINATNLALASQLAGMLAQLVALVAKKFCTHFRIENALVPLEREEHLTEGAVLAEDPSAALNELLVQAVMELNDHRMDVYMKLADILISRFDHHLKIWFAVGAPNNNSNAPLEGIVKDFTQMYKVLLKSLQAENLKRVFSRAFSESSSRFADKVQEIGSSPSVSPAVLSELACKVRIDLLFLYQNLLVGESMGGVKGSLNEMVSEMLTETEKLLPLMDKSSSAEAAVLKLRDLLKDN